MVLFILLWFADKDRRGDLLLAVEASISGLLLNTVFTLFYFHPPDDLTHSSPVNEDTFIEKIPLCIRS